MLTFSSIFNENGKGSFETLHYCKIDIKIVSKLDLYTILISILQWCKASIEPLAVLLSSYKIYGFRKG